METGQWEAGWRVWSGLQTVSHVLSWQSDGWKEHTVPPAEEKREKITSWGASSLAQSANKVFGIITIRMENSKPHAIFTTATIRNYSTIQRAKKRLKIMRRESGSFIFYSHHRPGQILFCCNSNTPCGARRSSYHVKLAVYAGGSSLCCCSVNQTWPHT